MLFIYAALGNGDGSFHTPALFYAPYGSGLVVTDFDQDGLDDIAAVSLIGVETLMGTRDGLMRLVGFTGLPDYANDLLAQGDFNGDGKIDLAAGFQGGEIAVLPGNGDGTFGPMILYPIAPNPAAIVVGDFNGDGRPDIFAGQYPGFSVLYGVSGVITATGTPQTAFLGASFASPLAATIQDTGGNPIAGVTVAYATAQAGAEAVLSSAAAVTNAAGVASITAIANNTAGSYTVLAGAGTLTTQFNLTNSVDVPASLTVLSGAPQSTAAGMPFPIPLKVLLKNAAGNPVSGATISFSTPPGILLASAAVATDATGQAQVYAKASDTPGDYSVVASSGALSAPFTLTVLPSVSVSLSTSPNPSVLGRPVMLTASVPPGVTGKVTFYDGITMLGTATISGQSASRSSILIPAGARRLTALYTGDGSHPASRSNVVAQTVTQTPNSSFSLGSPTFVGGTYRFGPTGGAIGDFNGDGIADLAVGNLTGLEQGSISVVPGNGDGTFGSPINYPNLGAPQALASGDFNGDGVTDLAVAVQGTGIVILFGNGDGSMHLGSTYAPGTTTNVVVTDLNGDGRADLAMLDGSNATLTLLLGNGDGTFQQPVMYDAGGSSPNSLVVADFNGDGSPDFAFVTGLNPVAVTIRLANPDGTLQAAQQQATAIISISSLAAGDLSGDGRTDLIVAGAESWQVLLGNGDGTFGQLTRTDSPDWVDSPVVVDFNGDGRLDVALIYGSSGGQGVMLLPGQGDGTFAAPIGYAGTSSYLPVGSTAFTGGGKANLALLDTVNLSALLLRDPAPGLTVSATHTFSLWQGEIEAGYTLTVANNHDTATVGAIAVTDTLPASLAAIAISGAGWNCDLPTLTCTRQDSLAPGDSYPPILLAFNVATDAPGLVVNSASVSVGGVTASTANDPTTIAQPLFQTAITLTVSPNTANLGQSVTLTAHIGASGSPVISGQVVFYEGASILGRGTVSFPSGAASITAGPLPAGTHLLRALYIGDMVFGTSASPTVSLTVQSGSSGGFSPLGGYAVPGNATSIVAGDFNGDGNADLAIANGSGFSVLMGSGSATFQPPVNYTASRVATFVATGDLNGDGKPDLVTANPSSNDVTVFLGAGDGTFQAGVTYPVGIGPYSVAIADLNGDGFADLAVPNAHGNSVTILLGKGDGTFQTFVSYPAPTGAYSVASEDFNGDSKPDLAITSYSGSVTILMARGNGTFQPPVTVPAPGNPVAIEAADLNGDGKVDLVVAGGNNVSVLLGKGDGTFQAALRYTPGWSVSALAAGDFNGDGRLDVAAGSGSGGGVIVLLGNGDGTFGASTNYAMGSTVTSLAVADFGGDGKADLAVTTGSALFATPNALSGAHGMGLGINGANNVLILAGAGVGGVICGVDTAGVQVILDEALGIEAAVHDLNGGGVVNVIDVQIAINAAGVSGCTAR